MDIKTFEKDNYSVLKIKGSVDMYTALDIKSAADALNISDGHALIFDLAGVNYIDSSGIGTLIKILNEVDEKNGHFYMTNLKPMIEKIFKVAGLVSYFSILSTEDYEEKYPVE